MLRSWKLTSIRGFLASCACCLATSAAAAAWHCRYFPRGFPRTFNGKHSNIGAGLWALQDFQCQIFNDRGRIYECWMNDSGQFFALFDVLSFGWGNCRDSFERCQSSYVSSLQCRWMCNSWSTVHWSSWNLFYSALYENFGKPWSTYFWYTSNHKLQTNPTETPFFQRKKTKKHGPSTSKCWLKDPGEWMDRYILFWNWKNERCSKLAMHPWRHVWVAWPGP